MGEKTPQKEIEELEDSVKKAIGSLSGEFNNELSSLEDIVRGALTELTDLENNLIDIIAPSSSNQENKDSKYLLVVRRFQNAMKVALLDGVRKRDLKTFEEGFNFYNSALEIINATGNQSEIEQVMSEFAQILIKITTNTENANDSNFEPFALKACKSLAEIYDSFNNFETSVKFHIRSGDLMSDSPLIAELEYFQAAIDYILLNNIKTAQDIIDKIQLKHYKNLANNVMNAVNETKPDLIKQVKGKIEVIAAQRRLDAKNTGYLLDLLINRLTNVEESVMETIKVPAEAIQLSDEKVNAIKDSLTKGIQQLQAAYPNIEIPLTAKINTSEIVSELKEIISSEISKEIKSLSNDIVSKILRNLPSGGGGGYSRPRSAGTISDEGMPDIEAVEGGPRERPQRPKLDDMLDSVIVSE